MPIKWTRLALADLENAFEFIAQDDPHAALGVLDRIEQSVTHLSRHPEMGRTGMVPDTREFIVPQTPYIVIYRVKSDCLEVLAVLHSARKWPDAL